MSLNLLFIMTALLLTDYAVGLLYGIWNGGFDKEKCIRGAQRYFLIFAGYGALALIAHLSSYRFEGMQYLSGLLLEPIARYFVRLLDRLKGLFSAERENSAEKQAGNQRAQEALAETIVTVEALPAAVAAPQAAQSLVTVLRADMAEPAEAVASTREKVFQEAVTVSTAETAATPKKATARRRSQPAGKNAKSGKAVKSAT